MVRDRLGSDYSENMSDSTTCSCMTSSVEKCSLRSCGGMFQEPFFLHPPGTRPRDGIYINPMTTYIGDPPKSKESAHESFYLHSPHDPVYTRITHLFNNHDNEKSRNGEHRTTATLLERKDETLTVKVDVHINDGAFKSINNGNSVRSSDTEHAYEQICVRQGETDSVSSSSQKKLSDNISDSSRSVKADRRFSRSSSASESSNMSSEIHCYSSTTSTPSLSRNSSNERINRSPKVNVENSSIEKRDTTSAQVESEKDAKTGIVSGPNFIKPPPPPPPPPPDKDELIVINAGKPTTENSNGIINGSNNNNHLVNREDKKDGNSEGHPSDTKSETGSVASATNKSDVSSEHPEVTSISTPVEIEESKTTTQVVPPHHPISKHMVLPFIPPKFTNAADSNTLLKPSEYLKSICKGSGKNSLSKARSVDNLDFHVRSTCEEESRKQQQQQEEEEEGEGEKKSLVPVGPPPPPLPPLQKSSESQNTTEQRTSTDPSPESPRTPQPLATISIQDLTSVQLRRTNIKMHATKTFSAPPARSASMTNVSEPFFVQKTDLIAELKKTKDIPGIKKLKVERAQVEKKEEQNLMSEISKAFSVSKFVDQIPEKDSSGNVIPIWKRQMLARKAAERAKKELEEQIARENEERRQKAIPPWKRQLLAKKDCDDKKTPVTVTPVANATTVAKKPEAETLPSTKRELSPARRLSGMKIKDENGKVEIEEKHSNNDDAKSDSDDGQIIPWRAQLRKTNSKLNILD